MWGPRWSDTCIIWAVLSVGCILLLYFTWVYFFFIVPLFFRVSVNFTRCLLVRLSSYFLWRISFLAFDQFHEFWFEVVFSVVRIHSLGIRTLAHLKAISRFIRQLVPYCVKLFVSGIVCSIQGLGTPVLFHTLNVVLRVLVQLSRQFIVFIFLSSIQYSYGNLLNSCLICFPFWAYWENKNEKEYQEE